MCPRCPFNLTDSVIQIDAREIGFVFMNCVKLCIDTIYSFGTLLDKEDGGKCRFFTYLA